MTYRNINWLGCYEGYEGIHCYVKDLHCDVNKSFRGLKYVKYLNDGSGFDEKVKGKEKHISNF